MGYVGCRLWRRRCCCARAGHHVYIIHARSNVTVAAPTIPVSRPSFCRVLPGMHDYSYYDDTFVSSTLPFLRRMDDDNLAGTLRMAVKPNCGSAWPTWRHVAVRSGVHTGAATWQQPGITTPAPAPVQANACGAQPGGRAGGTVSDSGNSSHCAWREAHGTGTLSAAVRGATQRVPRRRLLE